MQKYIVLLALQICVSTHMGAMQQGQRSSRCCGLETAAYAIGSQMGRNDYLWLASTGAAWFLRNKIELKENIEDLDRYYVRQERVFYASILNELNTTADNDRPVTLYCTPLHEAVHSGHLRCIQLLCNAGADKSKTIKSSYYETLNNEDIASESKFQRISQATYGVEAEKLVTEIKKTCDSNYVGLSAVDLAKKLAENRILFDPVPTERRQAIYNFLTIDDEKKHS